MSEQRTAQAAHKADDTNGDEDEAGAEAIAKELRESGEEASVAKHHKEMDRIGAEIKGEGEID